MNIAAVWQSLIVCGASATSDNPAKQACSYYDLIKLVSACITDLTLLATLLTVVGCIFIGFNLMTAGGNSGARQKAKERATKILIGYIIILSAWLVVYTITSKLLDPNAYVQVLGTPAQTQ